MSVELIGFAELEQKLEAMGQEGTNIARKALNENHGAVLQKLKIDAPKLTGQGAMHLKKCKTKTRNGKVWVMLGIDATNWDICRGLYFHHYGAYSRKGSMWFTESFNKIYPETNNKIKASVIRLLGQTWGG